MALIIDTHLHVWQALAAAVPSVATIVSPHEDVPMERARDVLAAANIPRSQVAGWVLHPGGRDVLVALQEQMGLTEDDLRWSAAVLREFGNLSSASVYFVLQAALTDYEHALRLQPALEKEWRDAIAACKAGIK